MSTSVRNPAFDAVRISPDGTQLAWYRPYAPGSVTDRLPWLVICEDPALGVETHWMPESAVAGWTDLQDPDVTRADDALAAEAVTAADPLPAGLADRIRAAAAGDLPGAPAEAGGVQ